MHFWLLVLLYSTTLFLIASSMPHPQPNSTAFVTGAWTAEEDQTIRIMFSKPHRPRRVWSELSVALNRAPMQIRNHYATDLSLRFMNKNIRVKWTEKDDVRVVAEMKRSSDLGKVPDWAALTLDLNRTRAAIYIHYKRFPLGMPFGRQKSSFDQPKSMGVKEKSTSLDTKPQRVRLPEYTRQHGKWKPSEEMTILEMVRSATLHGQAPSWRSIAQRLGRSRISVYLRYKRKLQVAQMPDESTLDQDDSKGSAMPASAVFEADKDVFDRPDAFTHTESVESLIRCDSMSSFETLMDCSDAERLIATDDFADYWPLDDADLLLVDNTV